MAARELELVDAAPEDAELRNEVLRGLSLRPRMLPCKLFYDSIGSALFEKICEVEEYYVTRTELSLLRTHATEIADALGANCSLIEFGSGSGLKTRLLLDQLKAPSAYVPIDISRALLIASSKSLRQTYANLRVLPVCADYTRDFALPKALGTGQRAVFFPGSTIGNFDQHDAVQFLTRIHRVCGPGGLLLIGVDLKKDPRILEAAYNDRAGVTAEFNRNILQVINRVAGADFKPLDFRHSAIWNPSKGRIEMRLISELPQRISVGSDTIFFERDELIVTEHCYKYDLDEFQTLVEDCGFRVRTVWTDPQHYFSIQLLVAA